jgi:hypothetical protein
MEQHRLNPYFPSFNHLHTLDIKETILVPDVTAPDYLQQLDQWVHSDFFNRFHDVLVTHIRNEHRDLVSRAAFHRLMDPYITFQVDSAVVPLQEHIEELGDQHDDLASQLADLQNCYDTLEHILVLDGPLPPTYVSQFSQTTNQDVSSMGKSGDPHHAIDGEKKVEGKHRKDTMETWHKSLDKYPNRFTTVLHQSWPLPALLGGQYVCNILLTPVALHLNHFHHVRDINYVVPDIYFPFSIPKQCIFG